MTDKECENCDYENAVYKGRAYLACPKCNRDLTMELLLMHKAGVKGIPIP